MEGITYTVDAKGKRTGVIIDLKKHGELWEDVYDSLLVEQRKNEPRISMAAVERKFKSKLKKK
jgi:tRNA threonylcarbamoyladenosine modification (KEOPS) complex  Pcc1 subunit